MKSIRSTLRTVHALVIVILLSACADPIDYDERECNSLRQLNRAVIKAMCVPWGEAREDALRVLAEALEDYSDNSEGFFGDTITDLAGDVDAEDCIEAGLPDPGPKLSDPDKRIRAPIKNLSSTRTVKRSNSTEAPTPTCYFGN